MRKFFRRLGRGLLFLLPVALGAAAVWYAVQNREGPQRMPPEERVTPVRVVTVPIVDVVPRALGHGSVSPGRVWEAVGEVSGTVIYRHPDLEKGAILSAGTELLRIDATDYRLAVAQIEANIRSTEAQLAVLDVRALNAERSLAIEKRSIGLARKELERKQRLLRNGTISQASVDREERTVLAGEQSLQNLRNALNLLPAERAVLEATRDQLEGQLEMARRDLSRTSIFAPFDCRIAEVNVEKAQFAAKGKVLVAADSLDVAEVTAQVPIGNLLPLLPPDFELPQDPGAAMSRLREVAGLDAVVSLRIGRSEIEWPARFSRMSDTVPTPPSEVWPTVLPPIDRSKNERFFDTSGYGAGSGAVVLKKPCKNQRQYMLSPPAFYRFGTFAFRTEESVGMLIGYARVSKADGSQALDAQRDALAAAGMAPSRTLLI